MHSGPSKDAMAYADWLKEDSKFSDILVQISPALQGHAFPRLKLRYKPSLVQASYVYCFFQLHFYLGKYLESSTVRSSGYMAWVLE